ESPDSKEQGVRRKARPGNREYRATVTNRGKARMKRGNPPRCNPRTDQAARHMIEVRSIDKLSSKTESGLLAS
ncbi:TPA: hypothetical protein DEP06_01860, partial [Candidatus Daviesbacteria bacterium]|nr:hypothetical protein [Candidatus Daviesbacteria bacterium]